MNAAQAIDIGTEWVQGYAAQHPEFRGAHLMGGITSLPKDAPFPETTDLDLSILVEDPEQEHQGVPIDESYRGVLIEAGLRSVSLYGSPQDVLASPDLASNLAVDSILLDPYGLLRRIQPAVAAEYGRRCWVVRRCDWEKQQSIAPLERMAKASTAAEFLPGMLFVLLYLSGLIAVASLRPPTHRKCLVLLRELLQAEGRNDLYERTLEVAGCARMSATEVLRYHELHAAAFDRSLEVWRTPVLADFKLKPHVRPYLIDGSRLAIDHGDHREVMPWLCMGLVIHGQVIRNDAPAAESARYEQVLEGLYQLLDVATVASRSQKLRAVFELKDSFFALADEIVNRLPDDMPTVAATG